MFFLACSDSYFPEFEEDKHIVIESALQAGEDARARIHLSNSILDTTEAFFYPGPEETTTVSIFNISDPDVGRMAWSPVENLFIATTLPIVEGETYSISVVVDDKNVDSLYAETTVPFAVPLETVNADFESAREQAGDSIRWILPVEIEIPESSDPETFYQLVVELKNAEAASNGIILYDELSRNNVKILSAQTGITELIHKNGIFIDNSRLDDKTLRLELEFGISVQNESLVDSIAFTLNTLNKEFMEYHENTDRELRTSVLPLDEPQISETNIQNGYGLYGAFSSSSIIVPL